MPGQGSTFVREEATMGASEEAVVRRFYEEMNNGRKNELAGELFTDDHVLCTTPKSPPDPGPAAWPTRSLYTSRASTGTGKSKRSSPRVTGSTVNKIKC